MIGLDLIQVMDLYLGEQRFSFGQGAVYIGCILSSNSSFSHPSSIVERGSLRLRLRVLTPILEKITKKTKKLIMLHVASPCKKDDCATNPEYKYIWIARNEHLFRF
jgi:hypothetical protein